MAARDADGRVVFVRHGLPGERVVAVITERHATWARADVVDVLEASPDRVVPPCPFAGPGRCGGCDYQHARLPAQRELKRQRLAGQLAAVAGLDLDVPVEAVTDGDGLATRTRVRFATDARGGLAMRRSGSRDLVPVDRCALAAAAIDALGLAQLPLPAGAEVEATALEEDGPVTVTVTTPGRGGHPTTRLLDGPGLASGQVAHVGGLRFEVGPLSFWQVHQRAAATLVAAVAEGLALGASDRVLDLYCGAGLFSALAAREVGARGTVLGLDHSTAAIGDARRNLAAFPWATARVARVDARTVRGLDLAPTHAVMDPPRRGVPRAGLEALADLPSLRRVVSVSCDPATFARDLRVLVASGWRLTAVRAFDLFEHTEHLECVATLER